MSETASRAADGSSLGDRLILVVGARRSGTSWIARTIATHPAVAYLPTETYLFAHLDQLAAGFQHASMGSLHVGTTYVERDTLVRALRGLSEAVLEPLLAMRPGCDRLLERTPDHCRNLELIAEVHPGAHVVHIIRNGRDVARSLSSMRWTTADARAGAEEWVSSVTTAREAGGCMVHYQELRYEALVADPRRELTRIFELLDLRASDQLVDGALLEAAIPDNLDPAMPTLGTEKWRTGLRPEELGAVEAVAGPLLAELGYPAAPRRDGRKPFVGSATRAARGAAVRARRRLAPNPTSRAAAEPEYSDLTWAQHTVDRFLGDIRAGRADRARALLDPQVRATVVSSDGEWTGLGEAAADRILDALTTDVVVMGPQARSDVHPGAPAYTLVLVGRVGDRLETRTLLLGVRDRHIVSVAFYAMG